MDNHRTMYAVYKKGEGFYSQSSKLCRERLTPSRLYHNLARATEIKNNLPGAKVVHIDLYIRSNLID